MNMKKSCKFILLFAVLTLHAFGVLRPAFCHEGSGNGDGEERNQFEHLATYQGAATTFLLQLSHEEIEALMSGLNAETRNQLLASYSKWPTSVTVKEFIDLIDTGVPVSKLNEKERDFLLSNLDKEIQNYLLVNWSQWTENMDVADLKKTIKNWQSLPPEWAKNQDSITTIVEKIDETGQKAQAVLAYCPVSLPVSVALDAARAGAEARKNGKSTKEILNDVAVNGVTSFAINHYSKADKFLDKAKAGKYLEEKLPSMIKYLAYKETESKVGAAAQKGANVKAEDIKKVRVLTTFAKDLTYGVPMRKNRVKKPKYTSTIGYAPGQSHQTQHTAQ